MDEYWKRSGEIPTFGNLDFANELQITQHFKNARQAGLIRYSSSSGAIDPYVHGDYDLYAVDFKKPVRKATKNRERRYINVIFNDKETTLNMRKHGKLYDVREYPRKQTMNKNKMLHINNLVCPKPVDEDLYKISPELMRKTKRKKMLGFISKCLVPSACVS